MFNALKIAQDILDNNLVVELCDGKLIVAGYTYSKEQSDLIRAELEDMRRLSMRCTFVSDPVRTKLEALVLCMGEGA